MSTKEAIKELENEIKFCSPVTLTPEAAKAILQALTSKEEGSELIKYTKERFEHICKGEGDIQKITEFGGCMIIRFKNGSTYELSLQKVQLAKAVLDQSPPPEEGIKENIIEQVDAIISGTMVPMNRRETIIDLLNQLTERK